MSLDREFLERACFSISYTYKDRDIVETKIKRKDVLYPTCFSLFEWWIEFRLTSIFEKPWFLTWISTSSLLKEREKERTRKVLSRENRFFVERRRRRRNEKESFRKVVDTLGRKSSRRLSRSILYRIQVHHPTFSGKVTSPRSVNMVTHLINIFTPTGPTRRPSIVVVHVRRERSRAPKMTRRRQGRRITRMRVGAVFLRAAHVFQWRSQLCDKVHFARPTGWWRQSLPSFYPVGDSADIQSRNGTVRRRQRLSRVWKLNRCWWSSGLCNGIASKVV